jgi:hypothetical protein
MHRHKAFLLIPLALAACSKAAIPAQREGAPLGTVRVVMPASEQMPGPPAAGAQSTWAASPDARTARFGFAGQSPLLSLECRAGVLIVTRHIAAEIGAQALFALQGGGLIVRLPVDATSVPGMRGYLWQGTLAANDPGAAIFSTNFSGTLPGGGRIEVSGGDIPRALIERCKVTPRAASQTNPGAPE